MTEQPQPELLERFKPTGGRWLGVAGMVMLVILGAAIASTGLDRSNGALLAALALVLALVWAALVRPGLRAYDDHLLIRNPWSDVHIPWSEITDVEVRQTLQIYAGGKRHHCVAVGKSTRKLALGDRPGASTTDLDPHTDIDYADYVVSKIGDYATAGSDREGVYAEVTRRWAWPEIVATAVIAGVFVVLLLAG